ncbi:MAG: S4 domain-containing protein YaaA [Bacilli bacterium]|nr:S4 domain-containing protein YaaA [Bacilli bacterium]
MVKITIKTEYITLGQFLKFSGIIDNGGQTKSFLSSEKVLVNDEQEQRRGRKLYDGYIVTVLGKKYSIGKENVLS